MRRVSSELGFVSKVSGNTLRIRSREGELRAARKRLSVGNNYPFHTNSYRHSLAASVNLISISAVNYLREMPNKMITAC